MNTNLVADTLYTELAKIHSRVYRNKAATNATYPYVVFFVDNVVDTYPSQNYMIHIDVYDSATSTVRGINTLADSIEALNHTVIHNANITMQLERINRQFVENSDYIEAKYITMQFDCRVYF